MINEDRYTIGWMERGRTEVLYAKTHIEAMFAAANVAHDRSVWVGGVLHHRCLVYLYAPFGELLAVYGPSNKRHRVTPQARYMVAEKREKV